MTTIATLVTPLVRSFVGERPPVRIEFWDGSAFGPDDGNVGTLHVHSPDALRRILWAPNELGLGRAYVAGELDVEGDIIPLIELLPSRAGRTSSSAPTAAREALVAARRVGAAAAVRRRRRRRRRGQRAGATQCGATPERSATTTTSATSSTRSCSARR